MYFKKDKPNPLRPGSGGKKLNKKEEKFRGAWLAWLVEHVTHDLQVMSLSPTGYRDYKKISFKKKKGGKI